jgi:mRNA interferase RelE/StbE
VTRLIEPYGIVVTGAAKRDLGRIPEKYREAIVERIVGPIADNPYRNGGPLRAPWRGCLSSHCAGGLYRVIYRVDDDQRVATILRVQRRDDVYRPP